MVYVDKWTYRSHTITISPYKHGWKAHLYPPDHESHLDCCSVDKAEEIDDLRLQAESAVDRLIRDEKRR